MVLRSCFLMAAILNFSTIFSSLDAAQKNSRKERLFRETNQMHELATEMRRSLPNQPQQLPVLKKLVGHTSMIDRTIVTTFKNHEYLVSSSYDNTIRIWDLESDTFECVRTFTADEENPGLDVIDVISNQNDIYVIASYNHGKIRIWSYQQNACIGILDEHTARVISICHTDKTLITADQTDVICAWSWESKKCIIKKTYPNLNYVWQIIADNDEQELSIVASFTDYTFKTVSLTTDTMNTLDLEDKAYELFPFNRTSFIAISQIANPACIFSWKANEKTAIFEPVFPIGLDGAYDRDHQAIILSSMNGLFYVYEYADNNITFKYALECHELAALNPCWTRFTTSQKYIIHHTFVNPSKDPGQKTENLIFISPKPKN